MKICSKLNYMILFRFVLHTNITSHEI